MNCEKHPNRKLSSTNHCKQCARIIAYALVKSQKNEARRKRIATDPEHRLKKNTSNKLHRQNNKEEINTRKRKQYAIDPAAEYAKRSKWRKENPDKYKASKEANKEHHQKVMNDQYWNRGGREKHLKYMKDNRALYTFLASKRRANKKKATPKWLTKEHIEQMKEIYRTRPKGYHVDHIVPLQSDIVCGLHVPWNLQHLEGKKNIAKGSKLEL